MANAPARDQTVVTWASIGAPSAPLHPDHHRQAADAADDVGQVLAVAHVDREHDHGRAQIAFLVFDVVDVGFGFGDGGGDAGQHTGLVFHFHPDRGAEITADFAAPADRHPALRRLAQFRYIRAV